MHVSIDESGTFAASQELGSYCAVASYTIPEAGRREAEEALRRFKLRAGKSAFEEVKARDVSEDDYFFLLKELAKCPGVVIAVATDSSLNTDIASHKEQQAKKADDWAPHMHHADGQEMLRMFANDIRALSNQNYIELQCRAHLVWDVVRWATLYFVQRYPASLAHFRWNFDQKDINRTHLESTMSNLLGTLCQSISERNPLVMLIGANYTYFDRFESKGGDISWFPRSRDNARQMTAALFREHMQFVNSKTCAGVQIADLIVNGITRCLRGRFTDNDSAAALLGGLMIGVEKHMPSIEFVKFAGDEQSRLPTEVSRRVEIMAKNRNGMLAS